MGVLFDLFRHNVRLWKAYSTTLQTLNINYHQFQIRKNDGIESLHFTYGTGWFPVEFLNDLKHLNLSGCYKLKQTPDLSEVPNLKTLKTLTS
ncbi:hypothetical protein Ahy_A04g018143 [Arachis hypogaea]|uniref:Uncharacterized protein n=1 Tax=Arachis hypogaea TaxID=3818 RepID=A0A445DD03_ARAHY|nr:hypothetical protein Ahy_A04g018143 [Arachis hypogaea]